MDPEEGENKQSSHYVGKYAAEVVPYDRYIFQGQIGW